MKNFSLLIVFVLSTSFISAQDLVISETDLKVKLDSILAEGNLLYKYERAAWISTDLVRENPELTAEFGGYFIYEYEDGIKAIILENGDEKCIAEYYFEDDSNRPKWAKTEKRELSKKELILLEAREAVFANLDDPKYNISIMEGFVPNIIFIPYREKFKFYIIMGTPQNDVIPFGDDHLFITDKNGKIEHWQKFHSRLIPGYTKMEDSQVTEMMHSHLKSTPFITATDICTFMLYAPLYGLEAFTVYSPAIGKYMTYHLKDNRITVK